MHEFRDRFDAGRRLGTALANFAREDPVVVGLARGGVEVASEVAKALDARLEVLIARKVGAPTHPEYGIGAIAPGGVSVFDDEAVRRLSISNSELEAITQREVAEVERRLGLYRGDRPLEVSGRCAILVDDGLATGITALAAVRYARSLEPSKLIFAVPVSSEQGAALIRPEVDKFVCLLTPPLFCAVGSWYEDFSQTSDEQVLDLLCQAERRYSAGARHP